MTHESPEPRARRRRVLLAGKISHPVAMGGVDCRIADLSSTGALLVIFGALPLPSCFVLHTGEGARPAEVRRRRGERVGVEFLDQEPIPFAPRYLTGHEDLQAARDENQRLKEREKALLQRLAEVGWSPEDVC